MATFRCCLVLNSNHNIISPVSMKLNMDNTNVEEFEKEIIHIALNKFQQKYGIKRKKLCLYLENGNKLSSSSMGNMMIKECDYIHQDCKIFVSNGEIFSSSPMMIRSNEDTKNLEDPTVLYFKTIPKSSIKHVIGRKASHIKRIVGKSHLEDILIIQESKPHKKTKGKEFEQTEPWINHENDDPQKLIRYEIENIQDNEIEYPKSKRDKPVLVMRGKKSSIKSANTMINEYIGNEESSSNNALWANIQSIQEKKTQKLSKRFQKRNGIRQSILLSTQANLNRLTITTKIIKDDVPQDIAFPCLYLRGESNVVHQALETLNRHDIRYQVISFNELSNMNIETENEKALQIQDDTDSSFKFCDSD